MQQRNDKQLERSIQRLVEQQQKFNDRMVDFHKEDRRRIMELEEGFILLVKQNEAKDKAHEAYKAETNERLDRKARRIRWLGVGLSIVAFLFFVMFVASLFQ